MRLLQLVCVLFLLFSNLAAAEKQTMVSNDPLIEKGCHKDHHCRRGHRGHRGKRGHHGATGGLATNYAAGWDQAGQPLSSGNNPIQFAEPDLVTPVGIVHPFSSDSSKFQIVNSGIYLLEWFVSFTNTSGNVETIIAIHVDGVLINPSAFETLVTLEDATISGQVTLAISAGSVVQLVVDLAGAQTSEATGRELSITQIAS